MATVTVKGPLVVRTLCRAGRVHSLVNGSGVAVGVGVWVGVGEWVGVGGIGGSVGVGDGVAVAGGPEYSITNRGSKPGPSSRVPNCFQLVSPPSAPRSMIPWLGWLPAPQAWASPVTSRDTNFWFSSAKTVTDP